MLRRLLLLLLLPLSLPPLRAKSPVRFGAAPPSLAHPTPTLLLLSFGPSLGRGSESSPSPSLLSAQLLLLPATRNSIVASPTRALAGD